MSRRNKTDPDSVVSTGAMAATSPHAPNGVGRPKSRVTLESRTGVSDESWVEGRYGAEGQGVVSREAVWLSLLAAGVVCLVVGLSHALQYHEWFSPVLREVLIGVVVSVVFTLLAARHMVRVEKVESAKRRYASRFRHAAEAAGTMVYDIDAHTGRSEYQVGLQRLLGYSESEVTYDNRWWSLQVHPEDRDEVLQFRRKVVEGLMGVGRGEGGGEGEEAGASGQVRAGGGKESGKDSAEKQIDEFRMMYRIRDAHGIYRVIRDSARVIREFGAGGELMRVRLVGGVIDVTEEVSAREAETSARLAMVQAVRRFEGLAGTAPGIVWTTDPEGNADFMSEAWTRTTGQSTRDALGKGYLSRIHPGDMAENEVRWLKAAEEASVFETTVRYQTPEGDYRWHLTRARPMLAEWGPGETQLAMRYVTPRDRRKDGVGQEAETTGEFKAEGVRPRIRGWVAMAVDIHDLLQTQRLLAQSQSRLGEAEHRYRSLVEAFSHAVWTADPQGVLIEPMRFAELLNVSPGRLAGWDWQDLVHPEDRERLVGRWKHSLVTGENYEIEARFWHEGRGGGASEWRWMQNRAVPVRDGAGRITEWVGVTIDVHEQRENQRRLEEAKAAAEAASQAKDRFLAVLSHELRTPLNPVVLTVSALSEREELSTDLREQLQMVRRNLELESRLIDDLLDLSRVTTGKLRMRPKVTSVHESIRDALEAIGPDAAAKQIRVTQSLTANRDVVCVDDGRLQQVLWNLLKNAVKFTPEGGKVSVSTRRDRRSIVVEVADTGIGIEPDAIKRIFDAFVHADPSISREFGGLGLGLAISKAVTEMMNGSLTVVSEGLGLGATFTLRLPLAVARLPDAWRRPGEPGDPRPSRPADKLRLLLVEDHPDTARVVCRLLQMSGHDVTVAHSVNDALRVCDGANFDLLISDLGLPDATGYDLMRTLRKRHTRRGLPTPRAIAVSGYGMDEDVRKSRDAGFCEHLTKPLAFNTLNDAIRRVATMAGR